jgi:hypothetical protein
MGVLATSRSPVVECFFVVAEYFVAKNKTSGTTLIVLAHTLMLKVCISPSRIPSTYFHFTSGIHINI